MTPDSGTLPPTVRSLASNSTPGLCTTYSGLRARSTHSKVQVRALAQTPEGQDGIDRLPSTVRPETKEHPAPNRQSSTAFPQVGRC